MRYIYMVFAILFCLSFTAPSMANDETQNNDALDEVVNINADIVVPLLGEEKSPEALVEIGSSIVKKSKINAINLIEAPNQVFLEAVNVDSAKSESIWPIIFPLLIILGKHFCHEVLR